MSNSLNVTSPPAQPAPAAPSSASLPIRQRTSSFSGTTLGEERFFLVLAVFIGVFAGLAVVCFRLAIEWTSIALLGATPEPHTASTLRSRGGRIADCHSRDPRVSASAGQRGEPDQGSSLYF